MPPPPRGLQSHPVLSFLTFLTTGLPKKEIGLSLYLSKWVLWFLGSARAKLLASTTSKMELEMKVRNSADTLTFLAPLISVCSC